MINLKTILGIESFLSSTDQLLSLDLNLCVDNRVVSNDDVFIAIVGEKYNPLLHLDQVFDRGCRFVIYEKNDENDLKIKPHLNKLVFIAVTNIEDAIQELGAAVANSFRTRGGVIVAISGSNGKTTTKEILTHILCNLRSEESVVATQKNNNNHLGVPFTLFQIRRETEIAIVELGSNHPGEIEHLCKMIRPAYGVTTNIGDTHLEFFKNQENVFKEEAVLQDYCSEKFFINADDKWLKEISLKNGIHFGEKGEDYKFCLGANYKVNDTEVFNANILGKHNFINLMLSISIASEVLGKKIEAVIEQAKTFRPTFNRSQWIETKDHKIFLDAYNANPSSMKLALDEFLSHLKNSKVKPEDIAIVLGDMNELGKDEVAIHESFGETLVPESFGKAIFIGRFSKAYAKNFKGSSETFSDVASCKNEINRLMAKQKYIFIKGSRSLQLETILDIK